MIKGALGWGAPAPIPQNQYVSAVLASNPIAYWPMDDGVTALTEEVAGRNATLTGGNPAAPSCLADFENSENSVEFSPDGQVLIPTGDNFFDTLWTGSTDWTVEFIYNQNNDPAPAGQRILTRANNLDNSTEGWHIRIISDNPLEFGLLFLRTGAADQRNSSAGFPAAPDNQCYHVAVSWCQGLNDNRASWYFFGNLDTTPSNNIGTGGYTDPTLYPFQMGNTDPGTAINQLVGRLSHVAIYNRRLPEAELQQHVAASGIVAPSSF